MIRRRNGNDVTRQLINLHQQKGNDTLNLTGLVIVSALLADGVELIKKKYARDGSCIVEEPRQARVRFSKVRTNKSVVSNGKKLDGKGFSNCLGYRCFPVAWRAR